MVMVWDAHTSHDSGKPVWFASWTNDGFVARDGERVDTDNLWSVREHAWVEMYRQQQVIPGVSLRRCIGPSDEWCFEAHVETDYTLLEPDLFLQALVSNLAYSAGSNPEVLRSIQVGNDILLAPDRWRTFSLTDLFSLRPGEGVGERPRACRSA
jgi:hypothetical protein